MPSSQSQGGLTGYLYASLEVANRFSMKRNFGKTSIYIFVSQDLFPTVFSTCFYPPRRGCSGCRGHKQVFICYQNVCFMRTDWLKGIWLLILLRKCTKCNKMADEILCSLMQSSTCGEKNPSIINKLSFYIADCNVGKKCQGSSWQFYENNSSILRTSQKSKTNVRNC